MGLRRSVHMRLQNPTEGSAKPPSPPFFKGGNTCRRSLQIWLGVMRNQAFILAAKVSLARTASVGALLLSPRVVARHPSAAYGSAIEIARSRCRHAPPPFEPSGVYPRRHRRCVRARQAARLGRAAPGRPSGSRAPGEGAARVRSPCARPLCPALPLLEALCRAIPCLTGKRADGKTAGDLAAVSGHMDKFTPPRQPGSCRFSWPGTSPHRRGRWRRCVVPRRGRR